MFKVNKNIDHNGSVYLKDSQIKESDSGFQELFKSGHVVKVEGMKEVPAEMPENEVEEKKSKKK